MRFPTDHKSADAMLTGRCKDRRKLANNTYLERRPDGTIAVKLHATDVVTFRPDGSKVLDSGGWLTVTTKDRMNQTWPNGWHVRSERGRWYVVDVPYSDGMVIDPDGRPVDTGDGARIEAEDRANTRMRRDVNRFVRSITAADIVRTFSDTGGDCFVCRFGGTDCLASHVEEGYFHGTLAYRAVAAKGYPDPGIIMSWIFADAQRGSVDSLLTDALRKYLRRNLTVGAVAVS